MQELELHGGAKSKIKSQQRKPRWSTFSSRLTCIKYHLPTMLDVRITQVANQISLYLIFKCMVVITFLGNMVSRLEQSFCHGRPILQRKIFKNICNRRCLPLCILCLTSKYSSRNIQTVSNVTDCQGARWTISYHYGFCIGTTCNLKQLKAGGFKSALASLGQENTNCVLGN